VYGRVSALGAKTFRRELLRSAIAAALALSSGLVRAGGFEIPDNGAEAMGRGAAFVAKASDGTAIHHNPAGLARQRGTHALVNGNLYLHSFQFQRTGEYPDDPEDQATPWGGVRYPVAQNTAGPLFKPLLALTSDFGYFDRLTFGAGIFSPPSVSNRTFPLNVEGKPAPSRYDFVQSRSSLLYPTLSAAFRLASWLDVGASAHLVLASFDETRVSYADFGPETCSDNALDEDKKKEDFRCDSRTTLEAKGTSFAATLGLMARPTASLAFGASFRTPTNIAASGTVTPTAPPRLLPDGQELTPGAATYALQLPWAVRVGARYIGMDADFERYDLELDVTYEGWGTAQRLGPILTVPNLGAFKNIEAVFQHGYGNTFGLRGGGAYNIDTGDGIVSLRGGAYFDSSATDFKNTRLDFDTLAKVAGTIGLGYKVGSTSFDIGYAAVASIPRTVGLGDGGIRPVNDRAGGRTDGPNNEPLPVVNQGSYTGFTHIIALGISVSLESFFGPPRKVHYGNSYEPNYAGPADAEDEKNKPVNDAQKRDEKKTELAEKKPDEKKPDEKKPDEKKLDEEKGEVKKPAPSPLPPPPPDRADRPEVKPAAPPTATPTPTPKKEEKPPTKRKEWWEEPD
jgi:long-subunit fatty acid transport protein